MKTLFILMAIFCSVSASSGEALNFKVLNVLNKKANIKCSGVLLKTQKGCRAITNYHCIQGVSEEKDLAILPANLPVMKRSVVKELYKQMVFSPVNELPAKLIKTNSGADLAEITFDLSSVANFCQQANSVNDSLQDDHFKSKVPGRIGQIGCYAAAGMQMDDLNLFAEENIQLDSFFMESYIAQCPKKFSPITGSEIESNSVLVPDRSGLPGLDSLYKVNGINLSQGMSGGALFALKEGQFSFVGLSANFIPFQRSSYFIPLHEINRFFAQGNFGKSEIIKNGETELAADRTLKDKSKANEFVRKIFEYVIKKLDQRSSTNSSYQSYHSAGDTDHDDVGDEIIKSCQSDGKLGADPKDFVRPAVNSCIGLDQTRFSYEGVKHPDLPGKYLLGYKESQINGLKDLKEVGLDKKIEEKDKAELITRDIGGHPALSLRQDILKRMQGRYVGETTQGLVINDKDRDFQHVNDQKFHYMEITPSITVLSRAMVAHQLDEKQISAVVDQLTNQEKIPLAYSPVFVDRLLPWSTDTLEFGRSSEYKMSLLVKNELIKLVYENNKDRNIGGATNDSLVYRDEFEFRPRFSADFKTIYLDLKITRTNNNYEDITEKHYKRRSLQLVCDNRNFKKLICSNELMEFGLSDSGKNVEVRLSFWSGLRSKKEALLENSLKMSYFFGPVTKKIPLSDLRKSELDEGLPFKTFFDKRYFRIFEKDLFTPSEELFSLPKALDKFNLGPVEKMEHFSVLLDDGVLFHVVYTYDKSKKVYGAIYDREFRLYALVIKSKITTDNLTLLNVKN